MCDQVFRVAFYRRCQGQRARLAPIVYGRHFDHSERSLGQRAGLVKNDRVDLACRFQRQPVAHQDGINRLSALYLLQGLFDKAQEQAQLGIELGELLGETDWKSGFHLYSASLHLKAGDLEKALKECESALNVSSEAGILSKQREVLHLKGLIFLEMNRMDQVQIIADDLRSLLESGLNKKAKRFYWHLLGMIELKKKNFQEAIQHFKQAVALLPSQMEPEQGQAFFFESLGTQKCDQKEFDEILIV